jgi:hypothetical protein
MACCGSLKTVKVMAEIQPTRITVGGTIMAMAMTSHDLIYLLVRMKDGNGRLVCHELRGQTVGKLDLAQLDQYPLAVAPSVLRIAKDGAAWLGQGNALSQVEPDGRVREHREVACQTDESLASFLLLPDGIIASFFKPTRAKDLTARVARLNPDGTQRWSTFLPVGDVGYTGIVEMSVESSWQPRQKKPWRPRDWQPSYHEPLLLSDNRLLASYFEMRSGIGCSYCLDVDNGRLLWTTPLRPSSSLAIAGQGEFLVGVQGYGAFDTYHYGPDGAVRQHWPSHGYLLVTGEGEFRGVEMENSMPSRMSFSVFLRDESVRKGPHLNGYYTTYPVLDAQGVAAFWRNGKLRAVDADLKKRTLWQDKSIAEKAIMTRMLLASDGTLVFGLDDELFLFPAELGPMANCVWPCGSGNVECNPVVLGR